MREPGTMGRAAAGCPRCGARLKPDRDCRRAFLRCLACGARVDPATWVAHMDEEFEEAYANVPLSRL